MATNLDFWTLSFILGGGILPALFWLWFWLREDKDNPEPHGLILLTFLTGGIVVLFAAFFQCVITDLYVNGFASFNFDRLFGFKCLNTSVLEHSWGIVFIWATVEEGLKLFAAWIATRHRKALDEPVDYMIYLVTAALGFAAIENTLYLLSEVGANGFTGGLTSISVRFAGATLVHVLCSSLLGGIYALAHCKGRFSKVIHTIIGFGIASALHAAYNFFIINNAVSNKSSLPVLLGLWFGIFLLLIFFEKVKHIVCVVPFKRRNK